MGVSRWIKGGAVAAAAATVIGTASPAYAGGGLLGNLLGVVVGTVSTLLDTTTGLLTGAAWGYSSEQTPMSQVSRAIGATSLYNEGYSGKGVGVALIDTGVVPVQGLTSGNVVNGPDLSFESQAPSLRYLDGFGHGTHMAGIIAGNDGTWSGFKGVAPAATLVSVRVGTSNGAVDVSQVIAAIDWVVEHRNDPGLNIRVINLSVGTDGTQSYLVDPLTAAIENAWRHGIVVVVAGGNRGSQQSSLDEPAYDPYSIAVGAADLNGSTSSLNATVPAFSSRGSSTRRVDFVAPGQSIVSLRDPGSYVDTNFPGARVDTRFFKGSGTSQAAAVTSGAVALLLQARPSLTPDQVKALLSETAQPMPNADPAGAGAGLINVFDASVAPTPLATQTWPQANGSGSLQLSRGSTSLAVNGVTLSGEDDIFGAPWRPSVWAPESAAGDAWTGGVWNTNDWAGGCWCGTSWTSRTYGVANWSANDWGGTSWSSQSWASQSWASQSWAGAGWTGSGWDSQSWASQSWASQSWASQSWADASWN